MKTIILQGVTGSHAYGLDTETSDYDRGGIFVAPTESILSIRKPTESIHTTDPDSTTHEIEKYMRLAMGGNPTVLEYLWLDDYEILDHWGARLVTIRKSFLSNKIRASYGGYAYAQSVKLMQRNAEGKEGFSSAVKNRYAKHARHCFRLLDQGQQLLTTATLNVKVCNRDELFELGTLSPMALFTKFEQRKAEFDGMDSVLPDEPDYKKINDLLITIRRGHL